jgi:lipid-binding SYLF domain-containing protein
MKQMRNVRFYSSMIFIVAVILLLAGSAFGTTDKERGAAFGKPAKELDAIVDVAIERFYQEVEGAEGLAKSAKGILIIPNVVKGAFLVGGEYGEGALRVGGKSVDYYSTAAGSIGFQIGAQKKDIILMFMTDEALQKFQSSKGWEAGIDANVAMIKVGGGERVDTTTQQSPVLGFVFGPKGLMMDISLKGAKFTKLKKE